MADCQWERYAATRAPMPSQQRQIGICRCGPCQAARLLFQRMGTKASRPDADSAAITARFLVLAWKPEPPNEVA